MKKYLVGLWGVGLFCIAFLYLTACKDDSDLPRDALSRHIFRGTVREVTGEARLESFDGVTTRVSVGKKIFEKDALITESGSSVVLSVSDGSALKIDRKSEIQLYAMTIESLKQKVSIKLRQGTLLFDIQKQAVKDEFEIRSERLVSVVRGSAGFLENVDGLEVSSLKDGRLDVNVDNASAPPISSGQTMLANVNGIKILSLSCSGTLFLARALDSMATEAASELGVHASKLNLDKLESMLLKLDEVYKKKVDAFVKRTGREFKPKSLNEYIGRPSVSLEALFVPGAMVIVQEICDTIPENGLYKRIFEWDDSTAYGQKYFVVNCSDGEVEYICHKWSTNFVSEKMAEVLTKADERKLQTVKASDQQLQKLKPSVVIEGSGRERIHVLPEERDIPATLRFSVAGLMGADLKQIKKITVRRKGVVVKIYNGDELKANSFKLPIRLKQNRIAHFEVIVMFVNGKKIRGEKVYETYCYFDNYENGKKSNRVNDMTAEEEYKNVVSKRLLRDE